MNRFSAPALGLFGGAAARAVKALIVANVAVFLLQVVEMLVRVRLLEDFFGLTPHDVSRGALWQLASYMFLHGGPFHLLFNMLTLFMFGNDLERRWGTPRFVKYYLVTGVGAGLCSWLVALDSPATTIGASGAVYGVLLAYGLTYPERIVYLNFLVPVKVKYLVLIMGFIAFYSSVAESGGGIAHVAHLGGMGIGFVYLKARDYRVRFQEYRERQRRAALRKQFEIYYPELRRKLDDEKKGPTIH